VAESTLKSDERVFEFPDAMPASPSPDDRFAAELRGFGPVGILAILVILAGNSIFQATITGLVFGTIFAVTGRIWVIMFAHAAFDLTAVAIIYRDLEPGVAHFVFK
jgi:hypothetical protein